MHITIGKGTIISNILSKYTKQISLCVSHTTRDPRIGEVDGFHYHFTTKEFMKDKIDSQKYFLENAFVHGNVYGKLACSLIS